MKSLKAPSERIWRAFSTSTPAANQPFSFLRVNPALIGATSPPSGFS